MEEQVQLKEVVRKMLVGGVDKPLEQMKLIDAIQRLGVSYHFESEIEAALQYIHVNNHVCNGKDGADLYTVALRFR